MNNQLSVLKKLLDKNLSEMGFSCITSEKGAINYARELEERIHLFGFAYSTYADTFTLDHFGCSIIFKDVEKVITPLLVKNKLVGESYSLSATFRKDNHKSNINDHPIELNSQLDTSAAYVQIINFYELDCQEFFDQYDSVNDVLGFIHEMELSQLNSCLGTGAIFKKILIYHLANHEDTDSLFVALMNQVQEGMKSNPNEDLYQSYHDILIEIDKIISKKELV